MITEIVIRNLREGALTGTMGLQITLGPNDLDKIELDKILKLIADQLKSFKVISIYVPKSTDENLTFRALTLLWSTFYQQAQIQIVAHAQVYRPWFKFAHWLTLKTLATNYTGVPANEYHIMFQADDLDPAKDPNLSFVDGVQAYATIADTALLQKLFDFVIRHPNVPWKILSPQKLNIEKRIY